jgi:hypothetical protein
MLQLCDLVFPSLTASHNSIAAAQEELQTLLRPQKEGAWLVGMTVLQSPYTQTHAHTLSLSLSLSASPSPLSLSTVVFSFISLGLTQTYPKHLLVPEVVTICLPRTECLDTWR